MNSTSIDPFINPCVYSPQQATQLQDLYHEYGQNAGICVGGILSAAVSFFSMQKANALTDFTSDHFIDTGHSEIYPPKKGQALNRAAWESMAVGCWSAFFVSIKAGGEVGRTVANLQMMVNDYFCYMTQTGQIKNLY